MSTSNHRYWRSPRPFSVGVPALYVRRGGERLPLERFAGTDEGLRLSSRDVLGRLEIRFGDRMLPPRVDFGRDAQGKLEVLVSELEVPLETCVPHHLGALLDVVTMLELPEERRSDSFARRAHVEERSMDFERDGDDLAVWPVADLCEVIHVVEELGQRSTFYDLRKEWGVARIRYSDFRDTVIEAAAACDSQLRTKVPGCRARWRLRVSHGFWLGQLRDVLAGEFGYRGEYEGERRDDGAFREIFEGARLVPSCMEELEAGRVAPLDLAPMLEHVLDHRARWLSENFPGDEDEIDDAKAETSALRELLDPLRSQTLEAPLRLMTESLERSEDASLAEQCGNLRRSMHQPSWAVVQWVRRDAPSHEAFIALLRRVAEVGRAGFDLFDFEEVILEAVDMLVSDGAPESDFLRAFRRAHPKP